MDLRFSICDLQLNCFKRRRSRRCFQSQIANRKLQMRGFSFPEVLFAVAVLGIGFIMVAAIFPVAIMQTQAALEESTGTTVVRNGVELIGASRYMRKDTTPVLPALPYAFVPPTPNPIVPAAGAPVPSPCVYSFRDPRAGTTALLAQARADLWNSIRGDLIDSTDPRFATIPMYVREPNSNFIRIICVAVRLRNGERFERDRNAPQVGDAPALAAAAGGTIDPIELSPVPAAVTLVKGTTGADQITVEQLTNTDVSDYPGPVGNNLISLSAKVDVAARDGAFVIISDDRAVDSGTTPFVNDIGKANGRIYRLGQQINPTTWELAAGYDMASNLENLPQTGTKKAIAFIVGAGFASPDTPANGYGGANRSVQVFDNLISLKN
jgi:hypothetical protein